MLILHLKLVLIFLFVLFFQKELL